MTLKLLTTSVPGLDEVLGGGLPEYSFNLISGPPGCGKTTLVHQLAFANATSERSAIYFTVVGEPPLKMLRYQQQMGFFDRDKVGTVVRFVDLGPEVLTGDVGLVLAKIVREVESTSPALVIVDSFRSVLRAKLPAGADSLEEQSFLQRLALHLTTWQVTSFLIGEYAPDEMKDNPVFTIADSIVQLSQQRERNSVVRKMEVVKMRGMASMPGLHTFRISSQGVQVFPRTTSRPHGLPGTQRRLEVATRATFGSPELDEMLGGGLPSGDATLIAGPSGTGKTVLCSQFVAAGVLQGENGVMAVFEEYPEDYVARAQAMGFDLQAMAEAGKVEVLYLRPLDLSPDEVLFAIQQAVEKIGAKRLVIDSLNGVELALAPGFRDDFRESLYRLVGHLTGGGVSVMMTIELSEAFNELSFSTHAISFLAQNIVFLRYVEVDSQLRRMVAVIKMRRSAHSRELREYEITNHGLRVLAPFAEYEGVLTGVARPRIETVIKSSLAASVHHALGALRALDGAALLSWLRKKA
ncbi:MAG: protein kinase [Myxococcaceae bacterium]|nr:protein kinase [Myxococcaceae bacterium]